jgi:hypothetical protein
VTAAMEDTRSVSPGRQTLTVVVRVGYRFR